MTSSSMVIATCCRDLAYQTTAVKFGDALLIEQDEDGGGEMTLMLVRLYRQADFAVMRHHAPSAIDAVSATTDRQ